VDRILAAPLPWERLLGKVILVTGAGGFLPSYLVATLAGLNDRHPENPCTIIALVRSRQRAARRLGYLFDRVDLHLLEHDVVDPLDIDGSVDVIVHAASQASPRFYLTDPVGTLLANVAGTRTVLDLAVAKKSERVLFFSSGAVYGESERVPTREGDYGFIDPATVGACYGEGKRAAETMCMAYAHQFGVPIRMVRLFHTYGPGIDLEDGRIFSDFVRDILAGRDLVMTSDGLARRAFCYAADATEGVLTVLFNGDNATPYNIGNEAAEVSMRRLADILVHDAFPELGLTATYDSSRQSEDYAKSPVSRTAPDTTRARALGWVARTGIVEGFRRTVASFRPTP
jgi:nucleoside-diphosphate-sugar epimerase